MFAVTSQMLAVPNHHCTQNQPEMELHVRRGSLAPLALDRRAGHRHEAVDLVGYIAAAVGAL
jgi:hypothetical protein